MISISMFSFLFGTVLGQRFKVLVLVPAMALVLVLSGAAGITHPHAAWEIIETAATAAICLQCGYFAGIAIRHCLTPVPSPQSQPLVGVKASPHHPAR
jgi:hypothetical protein